MSSLQQQGRYLNYSSNIQRSQGVFPQSLSGSETDVSTSNENLSHEERYVIRHTARQEPQGQENLQASNRSSLKESLPSNRSSLDVSTSSYNTLIIHSAGDEPWTGRLSGIRDHSDQSAYHPNSVINSQKRASNSPSPSLSNSTKDHSLRNSLESSGTRLYDTGVQEITDIPDDYLSQSSVLKHLAKEVKGPSSNASSNMRDSGVSENVDIDRLSLTRKDSASVLDYEVHNLPPPPEYPKWIDKSPLQRYLQASVNRHKKNAEKISLSRSQPDLSCTGANKINSDIDFRRGVSAPRPRTKGREDIESSGELWPSAEMVEILIKENSALKLEVETCYQRISKTQKLEQEIGKVHRAQEELVQSCERRERLERAARSRLQSDGRRLQELNRALREQVELLSTQLLTMRTPVNDLPGSEGLRKELNKREVLITQLITQNKELVAAKERQEIELAAQRATLQEQRTHIDILDTALTNAQGNVVRLEEECRKKQMYVERVAQLQRALSSLQLASDRREQTERKLRLQLEQELRNERSKGSMGGDKNSGAEWRSNDDHANESGPELKRRLREKDEKIMRLEGECAKWEQRYLEESALRQAAIDAASIPKDAKIAALEKTSQETEKLIAEARSEKIRHMDEVHAAQKKVADLESRVKDLESKLAERDAMIRVLQKHTYDKDVSVSVSTSSSYPSMLGRSPHHTPHPSLHGSPDLDTVLGTSVSREELVSSVLTSSTGFGSSNSYAGSDSSYHMPSYSKYESNKSFDSTKKTLDDQLKELDSQLDSQLLSKRALCCFPGFSNPGTASRKGKIPKPLLASVNTVSHNHNAHNHSTHHGSLFGCESGGFLQNLVPATSRESGEMLLLEKQGLSSQQQRMQDATSTHGDSQVLQGPITTSKSTSAQNNSNKTTSNINNSNNNKNSSSSNNNTNNTSSNNSNNNNNNNSNENTASTGSNSSLRHRSGSLPPSSLPRPPRSSHHRSGVPLPRRLGDYNRLDSGDTTPPPPRKKSDGGDSPQIPRRLGEYNRLESGDNISMTPPPPRKKSDGGESTSSAGSTSKRSLIPPAPRKLGEYNRLAESESNSRSSLRKPSLRGSGTVSNGTTSERNSASTLSDNSASSLPPPSKLRLFGAHTRRGSSLGREPKAPDSDRKYRIQF